MKQAPVIVCLAWAVLLGPAPRSLVAESPREWANKHVDRLIPEYEFLHRHPELSLHEEKTSERLAESLRKFGYEVTTNVGGHGIVGMLSNGSGKQLLIRTDMDALPISEQTGLEYASTVRVANPTGEGMVGVMHACGHDLHMTNFLGVAQYLAENQDRWQGTVMLIGQPAEERVLGARAMLDDGLYKRFGRPDFALALHVAPHPAGIVGVHAGYSMANVDSADITVHGVGGHGAYPHTTVDPIVQAAQLILALQTIVSREIEPIEPAVITVGSIHAGAKHNIISDECKLQLTIRSYSPKVRQQLKDAIVRKAKGIALSAGAAEPDVTFSEGAAAVFNDPALVARLKPIWQAALGELAVIDAPPVMGAEDFGMYSRENVPIVMFWLGSIEEQRHKQLDRPLSLHSPLYYPDPRPTLLTGITAMSCAALELLKPVNSKE